ncbi:hypothetical protein REPUB_Repub17cG0030600 [Reevesia pubescens]
MTFFLLFHQPATLFQSPKPQNSEHIIQKKLVFHISRFADQQESDHDKEQTCEDRATRSRHDGSTSSGDHPSHTIQASNNIFGPINVGLPRLAKINTRSAPYFSDIHREGKVMFKKLPNSSMSMFLVDSCNGLLCMRDTRGIYIYNPFARLHLDIPKLINYPAEVGHIAFGFHPTTNKYKVIQIVLRRQLIRRGGLIDVSASTLIQSLVHVLTIGDPAWRNIGMLPYDLTRPTPKALVKGRLHWLSKPNKYTTASLLISFDLETEQFQKLSKPDCCGLDRCFHDLMVLRGCLSAGAYHDNEQWEIWIMKEYGMKESWIKEFTIGAYLPQTLQQNDLLHFNNARARFPNSSVRVLSFLKNGKILLEYRNRVVVLYDPQHGTFEELTFPEMPHWFKIVVQVGTLNWIDTPINF